MSTSREQSFDQSIKILLLGDSGVGKTCLLLRYVDDKFSQSYVSTIGIDFKVKILSIESQRVRVQIWDTAGQERFRTITTSYFRGAAGCALCVDMTDRRTLATIENWAKQISDNADSDVVLILIATKADAVERHQVSRDDIAAVAARHNVKLFFTSAKLNDGIDAAFDHLARECVRKTLAAAPKRTTSEAVQLGDKGKGEAGKCGC